MPITRRARTAGLAGSPAVLVALAVALAMVGGCSSTDSDYFGPNEPTRVRVPTTMGDAVYLGVIVLEAHPGDTVRLESVIAAKVEGDATVEPIVHILHSDTRLIGGISESHIGDSIDLDAYRPFAGTSFDAADGPVAFAVRVTGTTPIHGFDGLTIRFSLNGEDERIEDWIPLRASICTAATYGESLEICRPIQQEMLSLTPSLGSSPPG